MQRSLTRGARDPGRRRDREPRLALQEAAIDVAHAPQVVAERERRRRTDADELIDFARRIVRSAKGAVVGQAGVGRRPGVQKRFADALSRGDHGRATPAARRAKPSAPGLADIAERLSDRLETRVKVDLGQRKGRITVEFASLEDLRRIIDIMDPRNRDDRPI